MRKIVILLIGFLLLPGVQLFSAFENTVTSARILGLGDAYVGMGEGGENAFLNPGILGLLKTRINISLTYSPLFTGLDDGSLNSGAVNAAGGLPKIGGFGLCLQYLTVDTDKVSSIYQEYKGTVSYGREFLQNMGLGINFKYYSWRAGSSTDFDGYSESLKNDLVSFDLGYFYQVSDKVGMGILVADLIQPEASSSSAAEGYTENLPVRVNAGFSFPLEFLFISIEGSYQERNSDLKLGGETYLLQNKLGLRTGFQFLNIAYGINFTAGLGYQIHKYFTADYGFLYPFTSISGMWGTHRLTVTFRM